MGASKSKRAHKARGTSGKKVGLVALAAAAMANPVASVPAAAENPSAVSPTTDRDLQIDEEMGTMEGVDAVPGTPATEAIGPPCKPKTPGEDSPDVGLVPGKDATQTLPIREKLQTTPIKEKPYIQPILHQAPSRTGPASPAAKDKALIYTGPSKPSK